MIGNYFHVLKTFSFKGRARRAEYWWFVLYNAIAQIALRFLSMALGLMLNSGENGELVLNHDMTRDSTALLEAIYSLLVLIQTIAVQVRRFHDRNLSGWWLVGAAVLGLCAGFVMVVEPSLKALALGLVGVIGLAIFVVTVLPGANEPNKYGRDPKLDPADDAAQTFA